MKTGLFLGSFNPIHIGHLAIANYMKEYTDMDEVWFVISPQNPFKKKDELLEDHLRLNMVNLALESYNCPSEYKVSEVEFDMPQPSYTIDTLERLTDTYKENNFVVILGEDSLLNFDRWKRYKDILALCSLYVYPRPNFEGSEFTTKTDERIQFVKAPQIEISSSFIREGIKQGHSLHFFLPEAVNNYIQTNNLYR
jgi:nicotinate-nucleotide adenylyltransferase